VTLFAKTKAISEIKRRIEYSRGLSVAVAKKIKTWCNKTSGNPFELFFKLKKYLRLKTLQKMKRM